MKLNEDTEFVPAPGEIMANDSNSLVVHPESELDIEVLEAKNEQRMVNCLNLSFSFENNDCIEMIICDFKFKALRLAHRLLTPYHPYW